MKRITLAASSILFLSTFAMADNAVWRSSHTATIDTAQTPCPATRKAQLHSVCINNADGTGTFTVFNGRGGQSSEVFAVIRATTAVAAGCSAYDVQLSSGLTYSKTATDDVTFMYACN